MKRTVAHLIALAVVLVIGSFVANAQMADDHSCVTPKPADANLFYTTPTAANLGTHCQAYAAHSCCKPAYAYTVANETDRIHAAIVNGVLTNVNAQCEKLFDDLACLFCSPSSGTFIRPINGPQGYEVLLCHSFCDTLYTACADALVTSEGSRKVSEVYPDSKDLCMSTAWYIPFSPEVVVDDPSCYDPEIRECTVDDYEGHYTECINGKRDYMYSWKHNANGEPLCSGGVKLPANKFQLRCDIACPAGQYLPGGASSCSPCPAGTFSIGGGVRISDWNPANGWSQFDEGSSLSFSTYCQNRKTGAVSDCSGWTLHGQYISSGDNKDEHDIESVLELDVVLVEAGNVSFSVRVDSEIGFDGLRFEVSSTESHTINQRGEFKEYTFSLAKGPHNLRWVYFKDFLFSAGEDRAYITWIEIDGTRFADEECSVCPAGMYTDEEGQKQCKFCGFNYIPTTTGKPTTCEPCPSDGYAIPGDFSCHPRDPCIPADYEEVYTDCRAPGVRDKIYQWIQPQICIDRNNILPANQVNIPCEPCNPGEYRAGNYKCRYCPDGRTSAGGDVTECTICQTNTAAIKGQVYNSFIGDWPTGWKTGCDACDTDGFRRHADHLDSGDGENLFFSWLAINDIYYVDGTFSFYATIDCPTADCSLAFWADELLVGNWFSSGDNRVVNITQDVKAGNRTFYLDFARWIPLTGHNHTNTRAVIHSISLMGTQIGGAPTCVPCPDGSVSREGSIMCTSCGPGSYPDPTVVGRCKPCPIDTIADKPGMAECLPCGPGTSTNGRQGQTECSNHGCIFNTSLAASWPLTFNLTPLARLDSMWGPVFDPVHGQSYWLNVCTRDHSNSTCRNADGSIMETFACQITAQGASKDLGRLMSFTYKTPINLDEENVVLTYQYGTQCEQDTFVKTPTPLQPSWGRLTGEGIRELRNIYAADGARNTYTHAPLVTRERPFRSTNLTIICDPTAGLGYPQAPPDGIEDQNELCRYDFVWYSLYGCHVCTKNDYDYRYTACENGLRMKTYYWKFSPRRCHGGDVTLPTDVAEACTPSTTICADGEFVSPQYNNCTDCPPGNFSIGGGERTEWWSQNLRGFTVFCETDKGAVKPSCTGGWVPEGRTITAKGNIVDTTVLSAERNFVAEGSVTFDFSLFTENEEPFLFYMDDRLIASWNQTTVLGHNSHTHHGISKGTHVFKWKFSPFFSAEQPRIAMIWSITFRHTQYNEAFCNPCPGILVQEEYGASGCHICPMNSVYHGPSACQRCAENEFALPGDSLCRPMQPCSPDDYYEVYLPCNNGKRSTTWMSKEPKICFGDAAPRDRFDLPCECPRGYYLQGDSCVTCPAGKHWDNTHCATAESGTAVVKVREWLTTADGAQVALVTPTREDMADHIWYTGCTGDCGNDGWRINGRQADSGAHFDAAVSWLAFYSTLEQDGEISFEIDISSHHQVGQEISLEFYINDTFLHIPRQPAPQTLTFPVTAGRHRFLWIHRQASQTVNGDQVSILSNVHVVGTTEGGMVKIVCPAGYYGRGSTAPCTPCPPGYYSSSSRQTQCTPCPHGTFSSTEAASACLACGLGTSPNKEEAATSCITTCKFETNTTVTVDGVATPVTYLFDLTPMSKYRPLVAEAVEKLGMKFTLQLCDKMTSLQQDNMCKQPTFVCEEEQSLHAYFTAGTLMAFQPHPGTSDKPVHSGFTLEYSQGSSEDCQGKNRKSVVQLQCRIGAIPYTLFKLDFDHHEAEARACEFHFVLETEYACPFCTDADIKVINGECVEGTREIKYEATIPCLGLPKTKTESCSNIEVNEFAILVIAGAVVAIFVVLMAVAIFFWNKKRQMAQKYDLLVAETQAPLEMQPVGGNVDEEN